MPSDDVVYKVLRATIDKRTTVICLHAHGQVQKVYQPYGTLAGVFMEPPFHVHCRSMSVPMLAGKTTMHRAMRSEANVEIMRRPPSQRAVAKAQKRARSLPPPDRGQPKLGGAQVDTGAGVPAPKLPPKKVEGAISTLPEGKIRQAIEADPNRYTMSPNSQRGVRQSWWVTDTKTGERWLLKKADYPEAESEVIVAHLQRQLDVKSGLARYADDADDGWSIARHVEDENPGWKIVTNDLDRIDEAKWSSITDEELVKVNMLDYVTGQTDRHQGNWMLMESKDGLRVVPVDNGSAFRTVVNSLRSEAGEPGGEFDEVFEVWDQQFGHALQERLRERIQAEPTAFVRLFDDVVQELQDLDLDDALSSVANLDPQFRDAFRLVMQTRIGKLEDGVDDVLLHMGIDEDRLFEARMALEKTVQKTKEVSPLIKKWGEVQSLADVDGKDVENLVDAMPSRFRVTPNGVVSKNPSKWIEDLQTGDRWLMKFGPESEIRAEVVIADLQKQIGLKAGTTRQIPGGVIQKHVEDESSWKMVKGLQGALNESKVDEVFERFDDFADDSEIMRMHLLDYVTGQKDRHSGNWMVLDDGTGHLHFAPVESGRALAKDANVSQSYKTWSVQRGHVQDIRTLLKKQVKALGPERALKAFDDALNSLKRMDLDSAFRLVDDEVGDAARKKMRKIIETRMDLLEEQRDEVLKALGIEAKAAKAAEKVAEASTNPRTKGSLRWLSDHVDMPGPATRDEVEDWVQTNRVEYLKAGGDFRVTDFVRDWSGGRYQHRIREEMAKGKWDDVIETAGIGVKSDKTLWRGMGVYNDDPAGAKYLPEEFAKMKPGDTIPLRGMSSFSEDRSWVERQFLQNDGSAKSGVLIELSDASGLPIRAISNTPGEQEWLIARDVVIDDVEFDPVHMMARVKAHVR